MVDSNVLLTRQTGHGSSSPNSVASPTSSDIDTSAPFESVKAAIGLFGDLSPKRGYNAHKRSKSTMDERVLEKETQHHLATKELESLKEQLRSIETSKAQALKDLEKAKYTLDKLTSKLEALCESKQAAIVATEDAKKMLEELEEERLTNSGEKRIENLRNQYKTSAAEITSVKQDIATLKEEFDEALEAKLAAFKEAEEAQHMLQENQQKATELSEQLTNLQKELNEVKRISQQAQDEHIKVMAEKQAKVQSCKASREEIQNKTSALKEEPGLDGDKNSNEKLEETNKAITSLTEQLKNVRATDKEALDSITSELELAKTDLLQVVCGQDSTSLADLLKQEREINAAFKSQAEDMKKETDVCKQEAQTTRLATEETEKNMQIALAEAKEAKAAINPESIIKLTAQEYDALKKKAELLKTDADIKAATGNAEVKTTKENENPVLHKLEVTQKENKALKEAIEDALKQAEKEDAAREVVEEELRKCRSEET
ncbi:hypothetical protein Leryth_011002 [Lithospermum erythrorhizon]|uniref:Uncharacterized protein n=1 Tax=Lithospermum erythrorhizon TaxID=34254 RepID=A0AAV3P345_LITER|nr:hypothetical protein Leryth_011002 [Lithospermum erythrorhizon]